MSNTSKYKVMKGGRDVKVSTTTKRSLVEKTVEVRANYCERSLSATFNIEPEETVENVEKYAKEQLMNKLASQFGSNHEIVLDDDLTDIIPQPLSKTMAWGRLPKDTTFVFWPAGEVGKDVPLNTAYKQALQTQILQEEAGRGNPSVPPNDEMYNMIKKLQEALAGSEARHEKEIAELRGNLDKVTGELELTNNKLIASATESKRSVSSLGSTVNKMQNTLRWLLYRHLLDSVRELVAKELGVKSWFDIDQAQRETMAMKALRTLAAKRVRSGFQLNTAEISAISSFLNNDRSDVRQQGNAAAHSGDQSDIREAIQMMRPEQTRKILSDCYTLLFGVNDIDDQ